MSTTLVITKILDGRDIMTSENAFIKAVESNGRSVLFWGVNKAFCSVKLNTHNIDAILSAELPVEVTIPLTEDECLSKQKVFQSGRYYTIERYEIPAHIPVTIKPID